MDPIHTINIDADSSFVLMLEAQRRGYSIFHYLPSSMAQCGREVSAEIRPLEVRREHGNHYRFGDPQRRSLKEFDLVLMRQDPPFDMAYIAATHMLEHVMDDTLVLNDPVEVRNAPEKMFCTKFPELMPPTLITADRDAIIEFRKEHKNIVIKPLNGNGGSQIFLLKEGDKNLNALLETFSALYTEPLVIQKFIPEISEGDKRIIMIDGKPAGGVARIPPGDDIRANFHVGGTGRKAELTKRDMEICEAVGPELAKRNLVFVGLDVIGHYMTEINVTSPTGIQEINNLNNMNIESGLWDSFEKKLEEFSADDSRPA